MKPQLKNNDVRGLLNFLEENENLFRVGDRSLSYKYRDIKKRCKYLLGDEETKKQAEIIPFFQLQMQSNK